ncbi:MAG: hypothetical protein IJS68_02395 [Clostridia bacterium]|nr:hypothetical protein [Clostridia bacterium]
MKKVLAFVFSVGFALMTLCVPMLFAVKVNATTYAISSNAISVLPATYSGANADSFTPFDFSLETRMSGNSYKPSVNEYGEFDVQIPITISENLAKTTNYVLGIWVYFPNRNLLDLTIGLSGTTSSLEDGNVSATISHTDLATLLTKTNVSEQDSVNGADGYSWNYLEIPFSAFIKTNAYEGDNYISFSSLDIKYTKYDETTTSDALQFYDAKIVEKTLINVYVEEENKQPYRLFKVNPQITFDDLFLGDKATLPARSSVVVYAWVGTKDIVAESSTHYFEVSVTANGTTEPWEYGGDYVFSSEGNTVIEFVVKNSAHETLLGTTYHCNIAEFKGVSINQNLNKFEKGVSQRIYYSLNKKLTSCGDLSFEVSNDCAKIVSMNLESRYVVVEMVKEGTFTLSVSTNGNRKYKADMVLEDSKQFKIVAPKDNHAGLKIAMWIMLGIVVGGGTVVGIKAIIKANKYKVR